MKRITENAMDSEFSGTAIVDRIRDTKSSYLLEQVAINKEFKSPLTPALLYNYYISVCLIKSYDLTNDAVVGRQLGYPAKTIGNVRRKLQKANWIHFDKFTHKGKSYGQWFLGLDVVVRYKTMEGNLSMEEQLKLGVITVDEYNLVGELNELPY